MRYKLSELAQHALFNILTFGLEKFGALQALKYQDSFRSTFELLAYSPGLGRKSERGVLGEHRFVHGRHVIYYTLHDDYILIEAVADSRSILDIWGSD